MQPTSFDPQLSQGAQLSNEELCKLFGCSLYGGMNRSLKTNTLVLVTNRIKSLYQDRIYDNTIHYTGMGKVGNQTLSSQNKTLYESASNKVGIHLFEVTTPQVYSYVGSVELSGSPYQEVQEDINGANRKVWMFPLKLKNGLSITPINEEKIKALEAIRTKNLRKLNDQELVKRALLAKKIPGSRDTITKIYQRDEYVTEAAKRRANGTCQLCNLPAPFKDKKGNPYLEVHHIVWLAEGGEDSLENTVALCPNCHRKMHQLDSDEDKKILIASLNLINMNAIS